MGKFVVKNNLEGKKFGRWTVLNYDKKSRWNCVCECGSERIVVAHELIHGFSKSCGCLAKELLSKRQRRYNTFDVNTKEYGIGITRNTNAEFCFDKEDFELIRDCTWFENNDGSILTNTTVKVPSKILSRLILITHGNQLLKNRKYIARHINGNKKDCRKQNLEVISQSKNSTLYKQSMGVSGVKGVYKTENGKYSARISKRYLGTFETIEEAIERRKQAEKDCCEGTDLVLPEKNEAPKEAPNWMNLEGKRFGMLTVGKYLKSSFWECKCDCGTITKKHSFNIRSGKTQSCGCISNDLRRATKRNKDKYDLESQSYGIGFTNNTGSKFYFDKKNYDKIKRYGWMEIQTGHILTRIGDDETMFLHDLIIPHKTNEHVLHANHNYKDNREESLRAVTKSHISINSKLNKNNKSGVKGVYITKHGTYSATIGKDNNSINLGTYNTLAEATIARKQGELDYYGEYSYSGIENPLIGVEAPCQNL